MATPDATVIVSHRAASSVDSVADYNEFNAVVCHATHVRYRHGFAFSLLTHNRAHIPWHLTVAHALRSLSLFTLWLMPVTRQKTLLLLPATDEMTFHQSNLDAAVTGHATAKVR